MNQEKNLRDQIPSISIEAIIDRYEVLLFDAYGVLLHSNGAIDGAPQLLKKLDQLKKPYYMLTNDASHLPESIAVKYQKQDLVMDPEHVITSGSLLLPYFQENNLIGSRCCVLGPEDCLRYVERAGGQIAGAKEEFDVLVIGDENGFPFIEVMDDALSSMFSKLDQGKSVELILPNPDLIYAKSEDSFGFTAGSIALMFEAALRVRYPNRTDLVFKALGKPHPLIFETAFKLSNTKNMVMFGDQLGTDIQGAIGFGLDSVLVLGGVSNLNEINLTETNRPTYTIASLMPQS
jgi:HAD superfamily hydrolase (TIGR01450 family)